MHFDAPGGRRSGAGFPVWPRSSLNFNEFLAHPRAAEWLRKGAGFSLTPAWENTAKTPRERPNAAYGGL